MMMKHFLSWCLVAGLLSACFEVPVEEGSSPPKTTSVDTLSAEQIMQEHSPEFLQYEPIPNSKTRFYDAQGNLTEKESKGGFFRKVLGKTPHNHLVLQDFYQDSEKPYTLPFVAVIDPQLKIFDGAGVRDSRTVWLKPDGSLLRVSDFKNGKAIGETWFFERNKAFAYIKLDPTLKPNLSPTVDESMGANTQPESASAASGVGVQAASRVAVAEKTPKNHKNQIKHTKPTKNTKPIKPQKNPNTQPENTENTAEWSLSKGAALMRFFYPNGTVMAELETDGLKQNHVVLFYPNGAIMLQIEDDGVQSSRTAWDAKGKKIAPADVEVEADVLALRIEHGLNLMGRSKSSLADLLLSR